MPRIPRGQAKGLIYHVLNRGNGRQRIFHNDQDYGAFLQLMKEAKEHIPVRLFAYCIMPNHFHLVLSTDEISDLSRWMQWLMTSHVRRYHRHYQSSGHVWQGRFKSFVIQDDNHLLTVLRYVEGNPVRASLVASAGDWAWSSHRRGTGNPHQELVDESPVALPSDWERFVDEPLTNAELEKLRESVIRQSPYGTETWQARVSVELGLESTIRPRGRPLKK